MIFGIGTDIVELSRISNVYLRHGHRFVNRLLSTRELQDFAGHHEPARFLAKRWAAKESFAKALGSGIRPPIALNAITIAHDVLGKPQIEVSAEIAEYMRLRMIGKSHLSISDEKGMILAFVVLEIIASQSNYAA